MNGNKVKLKVMECTLGLTEIGIKGSLSPVLSTERGFRNLAMVIFTKGIIKMESRVDLDSTFGQMDRISKVHLKTV